MKKYERLSRLIQVFPPVNRVPARGLWLLLLVSAVVFSLSMASSANGKRNSDKPTINGVDVEVENFGKVTDFYYRGAQPERDQYSQLTAIGVKTVIDLRNDPKDYAKSLAEQAGLRYINFPMSDKDYPSSDAAEKFLSLVNDQANWPVYVHCAGGRHRTGAMTAVFRMTMQNWDISRAYEEMKDYDFYTRWGHKAMKEYVYDYYRDLRTKRDERASVTTR